MKIIETGKEYTYRVKNDNYPDVEASFSIPEPLNIISVDTRLISMSPSYCPSCSPEKHLRFKLASENNRNIVEYFSIEINRYSLSIYDDPMASGAEPFISNSEGEFNLTSNFPYIEILKSYGYYYSATKTESNRGSIFFLSDKFSNKTIDTIVFDTKIDYYHSSDTISYTLHINSIEETMFKYMSSRGRGDEAEDNPFLEPVTIFSNVDNGLGIVTGYNDYSATFDVSKYHQDVENEYYY